MGARGFTHVERAARRETIKAEVASGIEVNLIASRYGLTVHYVRMIAKGIQRPRKRSHLRASRIAKLSELASLGITRTRSAKLLGIYPQTLSMLCKAHGITGFEYDRTGGWAEEIKKSRERAASMAALYADGRTLEQIGAQYGITRERVRQLIKKHFRMTGKDGGQTTMARRRAEQAKAKKDAASLAKHGCTYDQYRALGRKVTSAYISQRRNARLRGIGWEFNLWQWWCVWQASGHWAERGRGQGYVMCRNGDTGPYSPANVHIATAVQNVAEAAARKKLDPSLPVGVSRAKSGRYQAFRILNGKSLYLGTHDTPDLAYAAYLRAAVTVGVAA